VTMMNPRNAWEYVLVSVWVAMAGTLCCFKTPAFIRSFTVWKII